MKTPFLPDSLHRLVKHAVDSGAAESFDEAQERFLGYRLAIEVDDAYAHCLSHQATILTLAVLAPRVFLGGVTITGTLGAPLQTAFRHGERLADVLEDLGVTLCRAPAETPTIVVGSRAESRDGFCMRTAVGGWRGGVLPIDAPYDPAPGPDMPLSGMLAAALAINAAYAFVSGERPAAHRESSGLSLWSPGPETEWLCSDNTEPMLSFLPSQVWLIGLGHLGQSYLWALGLLPYVDPSEVLLGLQDIDHITESSQSTSVLSTLNMVGQRKTRAMAKWAEMVGFDCLICDRLFGADFVRQLNEPTVALCGVDNRTARRSLDNAGFDLVIEAGLGRGFGDFRKLRLHTLPSERSASDIWRSGSVNEVRPEGAAYEKLARQGILDQCGMTLLADKAVGSPFVGSVAGALAISELLRLLHGEKRSSQIDLDLTSIEHRSVSKKSGQMASFNPGFAMARERVAAEVVNPT